MHGRLILLTAAALLTIACSSSKPAPDPEPTTTTTRRSAEPVEEPTQQALRDSPCGNPDWAKLPAGASLEDPPEDEDDQ